MAFGDQDLDCFFRDGDVVTVLGTNRTFMAFFQQPEKIETFGSLNVKTPELGGQPQIEFSLAAAVEAGLVRGKTIEVRGVTWVVRDVDPKDDGQVAVGRLRKP